MSIVKNFSLGVLVCILFLFPACAVKNSSYSLFENKVRQVTTVEEAISLFGPPDVAMRQGDGLLRHSWIIHESNVVDGHYEKRYYNFFSGALGSDYESVYVPAKESRVYCFFNLYTGDNGDIINMTWEGNVCDYLLQRNLGGNRHNGLPQK